MNTAKKAAPPTRSIFSRKPLAKPSTKMRMR